MKKVLPIALVIALFIFIFDILGCSSNQLSNTTDSTALTASIDTGTITKPVAVIKVDSAAIKSLKKKFRIKHDDFKEVSFYQHLSWPKGWPDKKALYAYFNSDGDLFLVSNYYSDDWIFHTKAVVLIGENRYETSNVPTFNKMNNTQNAGGDVWENVTYSDIIDRAIVRQIAENTDKKIRVRLYGKFYSDFVLTDKDKKAFKDVWDLYSNMFPQL